MSGIGVIGAGNMGSALIGGLIQSGRFNGEQISVFDVDSGKIQKLQEELGIEAARNAQGVVNTSTQAVILAVKPQLMGTVLTEISSTVGDRPVVISIAAGITTDYILSKLSSKARVIRAMPNAPALVGRSATAVCKAGMADQDDLDAALGIFGSFGRAVAVEEKLMNAVTGLSGSGPAYLFAIMEALTDGGVLMGLDRATARDLTIQTVLGAAEMALKEQASFSDLKDRVTSPGGTTITGLNVMERAGLRGILMDAVAAATRRGDDLQSVK